MTDQEKRLQRLQRVSRLLADQALLPVKEATERVRRIESRIAEIAHHRAQLMTSAHDPSIAGTMLNQAGRLRAQQAAALTELAAARVALEKARLAAARAVGKDAALSALSDRNRARAELEARRRALRQG